MAVGLDPVVTSILEAVMATLGLLISVVDIPTEDIVRLAADRFIPDLIIAANTLMQSVIIAQVAHVAKLDTFQEVAAVALGLVAAVEYVHAVAQGPLV